MFLHAKKVLEYSGVKSSLFTRLCTITGSRQTNPQVYSVRKDGLCHVPGW